MSTNSNSSELRCHPPRRRSDAPGLVYPQPVLDTARDDAEEAITEAIRWAFSEAGREFYERRMADARAQISGGTPRAYIGELAIHRDGVSVTLHSEGGPIGSIEHRRGRRRFYSSPTDPGRVWLSSEWDGHSEIRIFE